MTYGGSLRLVARQGGRRIEGWTDLQWLVAVERIKQVQALYCYCMDVKDWDGYQAVYAEDAVLEVPAHHVESARRIEGRREIRRFVEGMVGTVATVHQCHTPVIEFVSTDEAVVVWAMEDMLRFPDGSATKTLHGMGHYFQRYRRVGEDWLIAHNVLARLRVEVT